ncbi:MAG: tRNA (guanine(10)-N(2))-dimethyltransferase [Candidatus Lokiarchaeota archaeon]|nr:tRNA (guanine(10)-N(2))-dimethyltransferase [Candidatus Lokiarchaeota archaeon]
MARASFHQGNVQPSKYSHSYPLIKNSIALLVLIHVVVLKEYSEGITKFLSADVEHYANEYGQPTTALPIFYNPRMRLNRDLSVLFLSACMSKFEIERLCEPLGGSGVRSLRYLNECPSSLECHVFDINPQAIEIAKKNLATHIENSRAFVKIGDAKVLILQESREKRYDCLDIDPFGSPTPFMNGAIQSLKPKQGLLALTATDMPALCGVYPDVAIRKYSGRSIRSPFAHEQAVRLLIGKAYHTAGMNDAAIRPLVVLSTDHYIRVWMEVKSSRTQANKQAKSIGIVRFCPRCLARDIHSVKNISMLTEFQHLKNECDQNPSIAGPLWIGELFDKEILHKAKELLPKYETHFHKRARKIVDMMMDESEIKKPLYNDIHSICDAYTLSPPKFSDVMKRLEERGYVVSRTHFKSTAIRTDASEKMIRKTIEEILEER